MDVKSFFRFGNNAPLAEKLKYLKEKMLRLKSRAEDIRGEVRNEALQARKKQRSEVSVWLEEVDSMEGKLKIIETDIEKGGLSGVKEKLDLMEETVQNLVKQSEFPRGIMLEDFNPNGLELVTEKLEGSTPSDVQDKVWSCFERGEVRVGLYGMGGVGKTSVAMHINNKILRERDTIFHRVFYVTVSRDTNVYKLQSDIAKAFEIRKLKYEDEPKRAAELRQELAKREGSLLILDDVWENISMAAVGACVEGDGCKLLITTRRKDVCHKMSCFPVKINPLSDEESWELFKKQLGNYEELPGDVQEIARLVAKECDGLPLGIITMAGCMRGEHMEPVWSNALRTLRDPSRSQHDPDMEDKVFKILRFSYDRLNDENHKKCFLYCALYPEDHKIERDELISQFIGEGFLEGGTRQEKIDRGHTLLTALENASLLESVENWQYKRSVKMHDLVRDMAIKIIGSKGLVKGGNSLKEIPGELRRINKNLKWVSLMENDIEEIGEVPNCPNVSVLLLQNNYGLKFISESFFVHMIGLNVLNLSWTMIKKLPDSVSDLVNLKALLLSGCERLYYISPIGKLTKLRELDLEGCYELTGLPKGIEELVSLELLNVDHIGIEVTLSGSFIGKLGRPQRLSSDDYIKVQPRESFSVRNMTRIIQVLFSNANLVNRCVDLSGLNQLKTYAVLVGNLNYVMFDKYGGSCAERILYIGRLKLSIGKEVRLQVPHNAEFLRFHKCRFGGRSLLDNVPSLRCAFQLKEFVIVSCEGIESIISEDGESKALAGIQKLKLERLDDLIGLIREEEVHPYISFAGLRRLEMSKCGKVKKLWMLNIDLPNLEEVEVQSCEQMELVFATESGATIELPRLRSVVLCDLPELRSISDNDVFCAGPPGLVKLQVSRCNKVKMLWPMKIGVPTELPKLMRNDSLDSLRVGDTTEDTAGPKLVRLEVQGSCKVNTLQSLRHIRTSLVEITVFECKQLENIFLARHVTEEEDTFHFPSLEKVTLIDLPKLRSTCLPIHTMSSLTTIEVSSCSLIKEIFLVEDETRDKAIQLPCLKKLRLDNLPQLRTIFAQLVAFPQLATLEVSNCPKLKKLDLLSHQLPSLTDLFVSGCEQLEDIFLARHVTEEEEEDTFHFPSLEKVSLIDLPKLRSTCLPIHSMPSLTTIEVSSCSLIEEIFLVEDEARDKAIQLPCLKNLNLCNLPQLRTIFAQLVAFPQLATLEVWNCPKLKKLDLPSHEQPFLTDLFVSGCQLIEEIFITEEDADVPTVAIQCPKLKRVTLLELPELKSICRKTLVCNSLEFLQLDHLSSYKLENFPISLPRLSTNDCNHEKHHPIPKFQGWNVSRDWWLSLRWNDPDTKAFFRQLGCFASSYF